MTEVIYQLMHDSLVKFMELGGLASALGATVGVNVIFMVVKAIRARGGIHVGKTIDALREDLNATGIAATIAEMLEGDVPIEALLAGLLIAFFLGTMLPVIYPKMVNSLFTISFASNRRVRKHVFRYKSISHGRCFCRRGHGLSRNS